MLGDWLEEDHGENLAAFFRLFGGLSAAVIGLTYFYNILGQWIGNHTHLQAVSKTGGLAFQACFEVFRGLIKKSLEG